MRKIFNHKKQDADYQRMSPEQVIMAMKPKHREVYEAWLGRPPGNRSAQEIAEITGVTRQSVMSWAKLYDFERLSAARDYQIIQKVEEKSIDQTVETLTKLRNRTYAMLEKFWEEWEKDPTLLEIHSVKDLNALTDQYLKLSTVAAPDKDDTQPRIPGISMHLEAHSPQMLSDFINVLRGAVRQQPTQYDAVVNRADLLQKATEVSEIIDSAKKSGNSDQTLDKKTVIDAELVGN